MSYKDIHPHNPQKRSLHRLVLGRKIKNSRNTDPCIAVCMPGKSCWDIGFLSKYDYRTNSKPYGRRFKKIIAIERDEGTADLIREKTKDNDLVEVHCCTVAEFFNAYEGEKIGFVFLDYYSSLSPVMMQDIEVIIERGLLENGANLILNFFGGREIKVNQIRQQRLFRTFIKSMGSDETWEEAGKDRRRCLAFNGFLRKTANSLTEQGTYSSVMPPTWYRYKTLKGLTMLTCAFSFLKQRGHKKTSTKATEKWLLLGSDGLKEHKTNVVCRDMFEVEYLVSSFYDKYHYTPQPRNLGVASDTRLGIAIDNLGLCPRSLPTIDQIKGELGRIYQREGYISMYFLYKAKLPVTWKAFKVADYASLCDEMDIPHRLYVQLVNKMRTRYETFVEYLDHRKRGGRITDFKRDNLRKQIGVRKLKSTPLSYFEDELTDMQSWFQQRGLNSDGSLPFSYSEDDIKQRYLEGEAVKSLASYYILTERRVKEVLKSLSVDRLTRSDRIYEMTEDILFDYELGFTINQLGAKYDLPFATVKGVLGSNHISTLTH